MFMDFRVLVESEFCCQLQTFSMLHISNANWRSLHVNPCCGFASFPCFSIPRIRLTENKYKINIKCKITIENVYCELFPVNLRMIFSFQDRLFARYAWYGSWLRSLGSSMYDAFVSYEQFPNELNHVISMFGWDRAPKLKPIHHH